MKYYHIIYNSSQRTQDGAAGLGIRTYTKGTPKEYLDLLKENEFFNYTSGSLNQPSPKTLMEDGEIILNYPVTYRFAKFFSGETGRDIYVLSRTASVGFDYPYYVKFVAARVDNFVTDAYVFEEFPPIEVFELLYEKPGYDSVCFIPRDRVPSPENEEMRTLSLGEMELLEAEEKPFACQSLQPVSDLAIELLFASFEAQRMKLPLLVKCEANEAPVLMADLMQLLPEANRKDAFFYTNYQLEGLKEGYKIFFVNEYYKYDFESSGQFYVFDVTQNRKLGIQEAELYRSELGAYFREGQTEDYQKLINWMMSQTYTENRDKSATTKKVLYKYIFDSKSFSFKDVFLGDDELLSTLKTYFAKDKANQAYFDKVLGAYLISEQKVGSELIALLEFTDKIQRLGFNIDEVVAKSKKVVTAKILQSPEMLKQAIDAMGMANLDKFLDKATFESKKPFLKENALKSDWPKIYKYFLNESEQNNHVGIIKLMLNIGLTESSVNEVVQGFGVDALKLCDYYAELAKRDPTTAVLLYKSIKGILLDLEKRRLLLPDPNLAKKIDDYVIASLINNSERPIGLESCHELMQLLSCNFDEKNANALTKRAMAIGTKQTLSILFENGLNFVKEKDFDSVVKQILEVVKPEKAEFIIKAEHNPHKVQLLASYFKQIGETKKSIEKLYNSGTLRLSEASYKELMDMLFAPQKKKSDIDEVGFKQLWVKWKRLIIPVAILIVVLVGFLVFRHPSDKPKDTFEVVGDSILEVSQNDTVKNDTNDTISLEEEGQNENNANAEQTEGSGTEANNGEENVQSNASETDSEGGSGQ